MRSHAEPDDAELPAAPDAELVLRAIANEHAAARELVRRYERPVYNLVLRIVRDVATAEDLTQETFLKVFRSLGTFDLRFRFSAWILKIAHNSALDHLRRLRIPYLSLDEEGREGETWADALPDAEAVWPDRATEQARLAQAVEAALARIRPEYRTVLTLRHNEDLDYAEIADILEVPIGTVKTFLHRGRQALARELTAAGWGKRA